MSSAAAVATSPEPVFRARGLTKVYRMGDVEVHALRGVADATVLGTTTERVVRYARKPVWAVVTPNR